MEDPMLRTLEELEKEPLKCPFFVTSVAPVVCDGTCALLVARRSKGANGEEQPVQYECAQVVTLVR